MVKLTFGDWSGDQYEGEWAENKAGYLDLHGWGILVSEEGNKVTEGYFMNGVLDGKCREISVSTFFEGSMQDGMMNG